jgi:HK97 gp10 family phage protein
MAQASGSLTLGMEFPELTELREQFKSLPKNIASKHLGAALRKAMVPGKSALRNSTPKGPTGNLRKSITVKIKTYPKDGNAVGIVGYSWGGASKGYHQGFVEFGTKERKTKGPVASSFAKRGQFTIARPRRLGKQPKNLFGAAGDRYAARYRSRLKVQTNPKYPKAFFKRAADGKVVKLGKMPVGGRAGVPPVKTAFKQAEPAMRSLLQAELATRLEKALNEVKGRAARGLIT